MLEFLGMYRQARTAHARQLTEGTFVSLGTSAMGGRDVCAQGALMALAAGRIANRRALLKTLELTEPLPDAALVLNAYRRWGADYPRRIEGAVVTAVIDRVEDRLLLTRDRMGAVPVYYAWRGRSAAFSGRPELLLRAGVAGRVVDREGILELFQVAGTSSPMRTPLRDVRRLEPGCVLVADVRGMRIKRYSSLEPREGGLCAARAALLSAIPEAGEEMPVLWHSGGAGSILLEGLAREKYMRPPEALHLREEGATHTSAEDGSAEEIVQTEAERDEAEEESVGILGFPDASPTNAVLLQLAGHSVRLSPRALLATGAGALFPAQTGRFEPERGLFPWQREACHLRFLKPSLRARLNPERYLRDRLHEALDRLPHSPEDDEDFVAFGLRAVFLLPALAAKTTALLAARGVQAEMPFVNEAVAAQLWGAGDARTRFLAPKTLASRRGNVPHALREEIARLLADPAQPIRALIDDAAVRDNAYGASPDVEELAFLLRVNAWMVQTEAEAEE